MSFWVGPEANTNDFIDAAVLTPGGLVPDKLRADESFNLPFPVILKPAGEIIDILLADTSLRKSLDAYIAACELAFNNTGTGKTSTSFVVPWTASYRISLQGEVTPAPILDEIGLRYLYKATIRDGSNIFGSLISTVGEVGTNIDLYCALLLAGLPVPDPAYEGLDCGGGGGTDTPLTYGIPSEPLNIYGTNTSTNEITLNWDRPFTTDTNRDGSVNFPFMDIYNTSFESVSSLRYPSFITHVGTGVLSPNETVIVEDLQPGHTYQFITQGKNKINPTFGPDSLPNTSYTDPPPRPDWLNFNDCGTINDLITLQSPYLADGAYTLDGSEYIFNIINEKNLLEGNGLVTSVLSDHRRNNELEGFITNETGVLTAYDHSLNVSISKELYGFGTSSVDGIYTSGSYPLSLLIGDDLDYYVTNTVVNQGFWKSYQVAVQVDRSFGGASDNISILEIDHVVNNTIHSTGNITYVVDNLNIEPVITQSQINNISNTTNNFEFISGIPTYLNGTTFNIQFNINNTHNYFIRHDKKHADIYLVDNYLNNITNLLEIKQPFFVNGTHKYYYANNSFAYITSNNTVGNGTVLLPNNVSETIQFNDFSLKLNSINTFTENLSLVVKPYNIYAVGNHTISGIIDPITGLHGGPMRFDTRSITTKNLLQNVSSIYGLHTRSGIGQYPCIENNTSIVYDHDLDLTLDVNNTEMQLVNGTFSTPAFGDGYKDYSQNYWSNNSIITSDYSQINSSTLYVTYKYSNRIILAKGCSLRFIDSENFDTQLPNDISLNIKLMENGQSCTGWLDANKIVGPNGARNFEKDGTPCLDFDSNETIKHCFLPIGSTGDLFIRMGFNTNSTKRIQSIKVNNLLVNQTFTTDINLFND
jgi:hypothetical protein